MTRWIPALVLALAVTGCGDKTKSKVKTEPMPVGFVDINLDDEDDALGEMYGSELFVATAQCGDLVQLEPAAMMGKLKDGEIRCLDDTLRNAERQTVKDKVSRVLMADAWMKADKHRWEGIVRRHLTDIDRSNPDLCLKFALHLSKKGPDYMEEAMKWADNALDNRSLWTGDNHVKNVYNLYKVKAYAAQKRWEYLELRYSDDPSDTLLDEKNEIRNLTKTLSREWLEYARVSGKDTTMAQQLCVSAAGTGGFCDEG